ncbi:hypothetical protein L873DRAFT_1797085 [Choiromyces venosus 120613-1]|uniref:Uncharacterized protein n=1 Tax=Choiromyces venosus 120613-1 TaxID=1336337 RepID=A0A3N4K6I3_9PEZI|nr:hypothetical protein L873DRAFT_1797085 [Choiromyces venosus 120613-1]
MGFGKLNNRARNEFGRGGRGKWTRHVLDRVHNEARYLYDEVDRDVRWEWSQGGLAVSDAELYQLGLLYEQEEVETVEEVEIASSVKQGFGVESEVGDDWSVLDNGESVAGDWDLISELG